MRHHERRSDIAQEGGQRGQISPVNQRYLGRGGGDWKDSEKAVVTTKKKGMSEGDFKKKCMGKKEKVGTGVFSLRDSGGGGKKL